MRAPRTLLLSVLLGTAVWAKPPAPSLFCQQYPSAPSCSGQTASCITCHVAPPELNAFGLDVRSHLSGPFETGLLAALAAVEGNDSDGDGAKNLEEILQGTWPGDPASVPTTLPVSEGSNPFYRVGEWDPQFALRRVSSAFCGRSPGYAELQALKSAPDPRAVVHQKLTECLKSPFWREEQLPRLADRRIRPLGSAGTCLNVYGNFEWDYYLFTYVLTDGRDARQLLTAQYHVRRQPDGQLVPADETQGTLTAPTSRVGLVCKDRYGNSPPKVGGQPLEKTKRAGMMTTQWFLWRNTMGALMPRGTAALAYDAWLGYQISLHEGLYPVPFEPRDIDLKNIARQPCSNCHSTLDPLAYAFSYYWGGVGAAAAEYTGVYSRNRYQALPDIPSSVKSSWAANPPRPYLFGQPLPLETETSTSALVELSQRAASSDAFAKNLAGLFFVFAVGHEPLPEEQAELEQLWRGLRTHNYSVDAMLHALVDTKAFGAP
jgi:hypothetical protein